MRRSLLILLLLAFLHSSAQQYIPFPTNNASWRYRTIDHINANGPKTLVSEKLLFVEGIDTIIKGFTYKKVMCRYHNDTIPPVYSSTPYPQYPAKTNLVGDKPDAFFAGFREDNKRIYTYGPYDTTDRLSFDLNLNVGDTVHSGQLAFLNRTIIAIDSMNINGIYHKRFNYSIIGSSPFFFIEGVGPHFLNLSHGQIGVYFDCFKDDLGSYVADTATCTYIFPYGTPTGINNVKQSQELSIFPNPFTDQLNINTAIPCTVTIYNAIGVKVLEQKLPVTQTINTNTLMNGIYIITVKDQDGKIISREKALKQ